MVPKGKSEMPMSKEGSSSQNKGKVVTQSVCNCDIKYFHCFRVGHITSQCPNKWAMFIREDREIESGWEEEENTMSHLEGDKDVEYPMYDEILVISRASSV